MFVIHPPNHLHAFAHYHTFPCSLSRLATTLTLSKSISVSSSGSGPAVKKKKCCLETRSKKPSRLTSPNKKQQTNCVLIRRKHFVCVCFYPLFSLSSESDSFLLLRVDVLIKHFLNLCPSLFLLSLYEPLFSWSYVLVIENSSALTQRTIRIKRFSPEDLQSKPDTNWQNIVTA